MQLLRVQRSHRQQHGVHAAEIAALDVGATLVRDRNGGESRHSPRLFVAIDQQAVAGEERPDRPDAGACERQTGLAEDVAAGVEVSGESQMVVLIGVGLALFVRRTLPGERIGQRRGVALGGQSLALGQRIDARRRSEAEQDEIGVAFGSNRGQLEVRHRPRLWRDLRIAQIDQHRRRQRADYGRGQRPCGELGDARRPDRHRLTTRAQTGWRPISFSGRRDR